MRTTPECRGRLVSHRSHLKLLRTLILCPSSGEAIESADNRKRSLGIPATLNFAPSSGGAKEGANNRTLCPLREQQASTAAGGPQRTPQASKAAGCFYVTTPHSQHS